jgi:hypothetical protein
MSRFTNKRPQWRIDVENHLGLGRDSIMSQESLLTMHGLLKRRDNEENMMYQCIYECMNDEKFNTYKILRKNHTKKFDELIMDGKKLERRKIHNNIKKRKLKEQKWKIFKLCAKILG